MTFFYREMPKLIEKRPPLPRPAATLPQMSRGGKVEYARDDAHKDELLATVFTATVKVEMTRFKGLGEMQAVNLRENHDGRDKRTLLKINVPTARRHRRPPRNDAHATLVEDLMGESPRSAMPSFRKTPNSPATSTFELAYRGLEG